MHECRPWVWPDELAAEVASTYESVQVGTTSMAMQRPCPVVRLVVQFAKKISQFGMRDLLVLTQWADAE
jgi:hypothetical protein